MSIRKPTNKEFVERMIRRKQCSTPYHSTGADVSNIVTDMDHFPYTRFYRGNPDSDCPIIFEREAGWRAVDNNCYKKQENLVVHHCPDHCWQGACSVILPCYQDKHHKCITLRR